MKRRLKFLLIAALVLLAIVGAGSSALNRWLQSPETHARLESEVGSAVRMRVKIEKITFSTWSGINVEGLTIPGGPANFFEASAITASPRLGPLLLGRIGLDEVRIVRPRIRMVESADGHWRMPQLPKAAETPAVVTAPAGAPPTASAPPAPKEKKHIVVRIGKILIADGSAELIDRRGLSFATVAGLNVTFNDVSEKAAAGNLDIASVILPGYATIDRLSMNADYRGGTISVRKMTANVCGGSVSGDFTSTAGAPSNTHLILDKVNIGLLGKEARAHIRNASGVVSGEARIVGIEGDRKAMTGRGTLVLTSGRCTEIELVRQIGEVLRVAAIAGFEVRNARTNFEIASERVLLAPMEISSHPLAMSLSGGVGFDGAVDLAGTLRAPSDFVARSSLIAGQFSPPDSSGHRSVQFDIRGTLDKPRQNLAEKLTGTTDRKAQRIIAAESIISALIEKKFRKPKAVEVKPPPTAAQP